MTGLNWEIKHEGAQTCVMAGPNEIIYGSLLNDGKEDGLLNR